MFLIIGIAAILMLISIYFFYRAEHFKKEISAYRREAKMTKQECLSMANAVVLASTQHQDLLKKRLKKMQDTIGVEDEPNPDLLIMSYLISQYSNVYRELLKEDETIQLSYKKFFGDTGKRYYADLDEYMRESDASLRKMWSSKDHCVYILFIDMLLESQERKLDKTSKKKAIA